MAAMTILDEIGGLFDALQGAQGGTLELRVARGADERTVHLVFTQKSRATDG
jgi:hypothetical protein